MLEPTRAESKTAEELTNIERAGIVLIALGRDISGQVMRNFPENEIEVLTTAIARMHNVEPDVELQVLKEFLTAMQASEFISEGGIDFARESFLNIDKKKKFTYIEES